MNRLHPATAPHPTIVHHQPPHSCTKRLIYLISFDCCRLLASASTFYHSTSRTSIYRASANLRTQCDETHPTCNNCKKSKRDCLGYDPIFRQQAASQSTTSLHPPSANQSPRQSSASAPVTPSAPPPPRLAPSAYGVQPPGVIPTSYPANHNTNGTNPPHIPPISTPASIKQEHRYSGSGYPPGPTDQAPRSYHSSPLYGSPRSLDHKQLPPPVSRLTHGGMYWFYIRLLRSFLNTTNVTCSDVEENESQRDHRSAGTFSSASADQPHRGNFQRYYQGIS